MYEVLETRDNLISSIVFTIWKAREAADKISECLLYPESDADIDPRYHGEMLIAILNGLGDRFYNLAFDLAQDYDAAMEAAQMSHPTNYVESVE